MNRLAYAALAAILALGFAGGIPTTAAQQTETIQLSTGCQILAFMPAYPAGTPLRPVTDGITGQNANPRLWFLASVSPPVFALYDPRSEERSTKTVLDAGDEAGFVCVDAPATWLRPLPGQGPPPPPPQESTATPTPTPVPGEPTATPTRDPNVTCDPSYPEICVPPPPPDLDCSDIEDREFTVLPPDPHGFDTDGDGIGCEVV